MKRVLSIGLVVLLAIALVACSPAAEQPAAEEPAAEEAAAEEAAEEPAAEEPAAEEAADEPAEDAPAAGDLKFGYVVNDMSHEWYQNVTKGAERRAEELGIDLVVADSAMDAAKQVTQIENQLTDGVDVACITPVDVKALAAVVKEANEMDVPVISESNFVDGALTMVGIDNVSGGKKAGEWFAEYAVENDIDPKILIVGLPAFEDCRQRVEGFKAGMDEAGLVYEIVQEVDGNGTKEDSLKMSQDALTAHPEVNVIFGINDNSTSGGMAAYKEAGLEESVLTAIGFGFEGAVGRDLLLSGGPYKASVAMFPDFMGGSLIDAAYKVAQGEEIPEHYESGTVVITEDNFDDFYTQEGDEYITNFDAIRALLDN